MMSLAEFTHKYPHCKSWADCKTRDEQRAFIFGWGSLNEVVNWIAENRNVENIEFALMEFFERGKRVSDEALLESFQRGWRAGSQYRDGQVVEPSGSRIALPDKEQP
jgi:hypothetical protein